MYTTTHLLWVISSCCKAIQLKGTSLFNTYNPFFDSAFPCGCTLEEPTRYMSTLLSKGRDSFFVWLTDCLIEGRRQIMPPFSIRLFLHSSKNCSIACAKVSKSKKFWSTNECNFTQKSINSFPVVEIEIDKCVWQPDLWLDRSRTTMWLYNIGVARCVV